MSRGNFYESLKFYALDMTFFFKKQNILSKYETSEGQLMKIHWALWKAVYIEVKLSSH